MKQTRPVTKERQEILSKDVGGRIHLSLQEISAYTNWDSNELVTACMECARTCRGLQGDAQGFGFGILHKRGIGGQKVPGVDKRSFYSHENKLHSGDAGVADGSRAGACFSRPALCWRAFAPHDLPMKRALSVVLLRATSLDRVNSCAFEE